MDMALGMRPARSRRHALNLSGHGMHHKQTAHSESWTQFEQYSATPTSRKDTSPQMKFKIEEPREKPKPVDLFSLTYQILHFAFHV